MCPLCCGERDTCYNLMRSAREFPEHLACFGIILWFTQYFVVYADDGVSRYEKLRWGKRIGLCFPLTNEQRNI